MSETVTNIGKSSDLKNDPAVLKFLSKETKNSSAIFKDYPPTSALVRAAIFDVMNTLSINIKK